MIDNIRGLLDQYTNWLRAKTVLREIPQCQWVEITTPFLDRHNDYLQIYARSQNGGYLLSDDGYVIDDLEQSGCKLGSEKRLSLLRTTLNGFGIQLVDNHRLETVASSDNFSQRKHNLVQAMLAVNDMFYLASPASSTLFVEDVTQWLESSDIRFTPKVTFTGKSGFDYRFEFVVPKSRLRPERVIQTLARPNDSSAKQLAFAWLDTKDARPADSVAYAIMNDSDHSVSSSVVEALRKYELIPVLWSRRDSVIQELAA